jgi:GPH family glycoside/pentoside/hexuronide:cation symporter
MKLTNGQKLLYAAGSLGVALSYQCFAAWIQFLYIDQLGLKAQLVGIGWSIYGIWNAINDPLAGYLSDRTRTRLGRRTPWILSGFIPLALFFYLLWVPPAPLLSGGETPLFVYFIAVVLIFDTLWSFVVMNWTSLFPEMISDEHERATVSGWRQLFSIVGLIIGVSLPPLLVGEDWSGRGVMAAIFAVVTAVTIGGTLLGSRERPASEAAAQPPFLPAFRATLTSSSFRWFLGANLFKEFIYIILAATIPFWAKYVLRVQAPANIGGMEIPVDLQTALLTGMAFIMAVPAIPVWTAICKRIGARRGWQLSQLTFALSAVGMFLAQNFIQGAASTAFVGLSLAGLLLYPDLVLSDVIDEDEIATGARREGMYFGINGFIIRFAFTLQGLATGLVLGATGYVAAADTALNPVQPASALLGIRMLVAGMPFLASLLVVFCLQRYPLHGQRLSLLRQRQTDLRRVAAAAGAAD